MMNNRTPLIRLVSTPDKSPENVAVDELGHILSCSPSARDGLTSLIREHDGEIAPLVSVESQENADHRLDLVGFDARGTVRVILEPEFEALLPYGNMNSYLDRLSPEGPAVLLFIASEEQIEAWYRYMWYGSLAGRLRKAGKKFTLSHHKLSAAVEGTEQRLALVSWSDLLNRIDYRLAEFAEVKASIQDLREFTEFMARSKRLIDDATRKGIAEGWAYTRRASTGHQELITTRKEYGYGRYIHLTGMHREGWFGINWHLWEESPDTVPLVFRPVDEDAPAMQGGGPLPLEEVYLDLGMKWIPIHLNPGSRDAENLPKVVSQLQAIARSFRAASRST